MSVAAATEAEVTAKRLSLQKSLAELCLRLKPNELAADIGEGMSSKLAVLSDKVSERAAKPAGLVGLCIMAFASTYALADNAGPAERSQDEAALLSAQPLRGETLAMIGQLSAAVAAGVIISKFVPATNGERELFAGVGPELRDMINKYVKRQVELVVTPSSDRFSVVSLLALGAAMFVKDRPARNN